MFGFIKKLFGGIFGFFGGLFGGKKSEDNQSNAPKAVQKSGYYMELKENEPTKSSVATQSKKPEPAKTPAPAAKAVSQPAPAPAAKAPAPAAATAAKAVAQPAKVETAAQAPKPEPVKFSEPEITSNNRRRPGANMTSFLDMARQVKTPS